MENAGMLFFLIAVIAIVVVPLAIRGSFRNRKQSRLQQAQRYLEEKKSSSQQQRTRTQRESAEKQRAVEEINKALQELPGWEIWDSSIQNNPEQIDRIHRCDEVQVMDYDGQRGLAKVKGSRGDFYLTGSEWCSCMDFKKRGLPCKHMYKLAFDLYRHSAPHIAPSERGPLYGFTYALAGRFPGTESDSNGFKAQLNSRGAVWTQDLYPEVTALVCGKSPSQNKIRYAQEHRIHIMSDAEALNLFKDRRNER